MLVNSLMIPFITQENLDAVFSKRKDGVSGLMRVKNEASTIEASILSVIDILDELVIIYHDCTDNSVAIINKYKELYPTKIKALEYSNTVIPANSGKYIDGFAPEESLANYYNFGLINCSYKWFMKIDADQIYIADELKKIISSREPGGYYCMVGFLTSIDSARNIAVSIFEDIPLNGFHGDHFLTEIKIGSRFQMTKHENGVYCQCEQYVEPNISWGVFNFSIGGAQWHHIRQFKDRGYDFILSLEERASVTKYITFDYLRAVLCKDKFTDDKIKNIVLSFNQSVEKLKQIEFNCT